MTWITQRRWTTVAVVTALLLVMLATAGLAGADVAPGNVAYDGRVVFVRLKYEMPRGLQTGFFQQDIKWAHDYPRAERNLTKILGEISLLEVFQGPNGGNVLALDDPELHKFPFAYMSEPGFWLPTEQEVMGLREYLLKGGFVIFDDFAELRGGWARFESAFRRVLPGARFYDLDASHQIFHSFFEIDSLDILPQYYDLGRPVLRAVFEDNDPRKRMMAVINYNTDISEYWEFSRAGWRPIHETNEAYKLGVNYIMYGMTH